MDSTIASELPAWTLESRASSLAFTFSGFLRRRKKSTEDSIWSLCIVVESLLRSADQGTDLRSRDSRKTRLQQNRSQECYTGAGQAEEPPRGVEMVKAPQSKEQNTQATHLDTHSSVCRRTYHLQQSPDNGRLPAVF